jgi:hypothetical protein
MTLRIYGKEPRDYAIFVQYGLEPWTKCGLSIDRALAHTKAYINYNPFSPDGDHLTGFYRRAERAFVIPNLWWGVMPQEPFIKTIQHEFGHHIHDEYMGPDGSTKWQEWARLTRRQLDFTVSTAERHQGRLYVKSYEDFAQDFERTIYGGQSWPVQDWLARLKFYASLWGQVLTVKIELPIGEKKMIVNGREEPIDVPAQIIAGRTMVPLRFVAEALGAEVDWEPKDGKTEKVFITKGG